MCGSSENSTGLAFDSIVDQEITSFSEFVHSARAKLVDVGAIFIGFGSLVSAAVIYFPATSSPANQAHAAIMVCASLTMLGLLVHVRVRPRASKSSFRNLLVLVSAVYLPNMIGQGVFHGEDHDRTFIALGILFGAVSMCPWRYMIFYGIMLSGWHWTSAFVDRQLTEVDLFYAWFLVPVMGLISGNSLRSHLASVFALHQDVRAREQELTFARQNLSQERKRREVEEERRRESEQIVHRQNEQLWHVNRISTLGEMVASIAHEINQPLNAMGMYVGVLLHDSAAEEERNRAASQIGSLVDRCGKIIARLRGFVRRDTAGDGEICMREMIEVSIALVANSARRQGVGIQFDSPLRAPETHVIASEIQLQQVIVNLLQNAIDATEWNEDEKLVEVGLRQDASSLEVWVSDNGCGLVDDADRQRVFEAFYTSKASGMGMGLAICRSILERYRGDITAESNISKGTTFRFRLPQSLARSDSRLPATSGSCEHAGQSRERD